MGMKKTLACTLFRIVFIGCIRNSIEPKRCSWVLICFLEAGLEEFLIKCTSKNSSGRWRQKFRVLVTESNFSLRDVLFRCIYKSSQSKTQNSIHPSIHLPTHLPTYLHLNLQHLIDTFNQSDYSIITLYSLSNGG